MQDLIPTSWLDATGLSAEQLLLLGGGVALLLFVVWPLVAAIRRSRVRRAPTLAITSFQIAPLGRDAFLKLHNPSEAITLTAVQLHGRTDVQVKNAVAGQQLSHQGDYRLLLEATEDQRLTADFDIEFTFANADRRSFKQRFSLNPIQQVSFKHL